VEYSSSIYSHFFPEPANKTSHSLTSTTYQDADKSLARPGRKQARKHVRDERDFNNIETRAGVKVPLQKSKAPKEIHAILTET
jgi:hypothetical protein